MYVHCKFIWSFWNDCSLLVLKENLLWKKYCLKDSSLAHFDYITCVSTSSTKQTRIQIQTVVLCYTLSTYSTFWVQIWHEGIDVMDVASNVKSKSKKSMAAWGQRAEQISHNASPVVNYRLSFVKCGIVPKEWETWLVCLLIISLCFCENGWDCFRRILS